MEASDLATGDSAGAGRVAIGRGAGFVPVCRDVGDACVLLVAAAPGAGLPVAGEEVGTAGGVAGERGAAGEDLGAGASAEPRARTSAATSEMPDIVTGRSASGDACRPPTVNCNASGRPVRSCGPWASCGTVQLSPSAISF